MANMSYCRFRNTLSDFNDCVSAIQGRIAEPREYGEISREEQQAARNLASAAVELLQALGDSVSECVFDSDAEVDDIIDNAFDKLFKASTEQSEEG